MPHMMPDTKPRNAERTLTHGLLRLYAQYAPKYTVDVRKMPEKWDCA